MGLCLPAAGRVRCPSGANSRFRRPARLRGRLSAASRLTRTTAGERRHPPALARPSREACRPPAGPSTRTDSPRVPGGRQPPQAAGGDLASLAVLPQAAAAAICRGRGSRRLWAARLKGEWGLLAPPCLGRRHRQRCPLRGSWCRSVRARCLEIGGNRAVVLRLFSRGNAGLLGLLLWSVTTLISPVFSFSFACFSSVVSETFWIAPHIARRQQGWRRGVKGVPEGMEGGSWALCRSSCWSESTRLVLGRFHQARKCGFLPVDSCPLNFFLVQKPRELLWKC